MCLEVKNIIFPDRSLKETNLNFVQIILFICSRLFFFSFCHHYYCITLVGHHFPVTIVYIAASQADANKIKFENRRDPHKDHLICGTHLRRRNLTKIIFVAHRDIFPQDQQRRWNRVGLFSRVRKFDNTQGVVHQACSPLFILNSCRSYSNSVFFSIFW